MPYQSFESYSQAHISLDVDFTVKARCTHLWVRKSVEGLLISRVCLLKVICHQIAVTYEQADRSDEHPHSQPCIPRPVDSPSEPQTSPFSGEMFNVRW